MLGLALFAALAMTDAWAAGGEESEGSIARFYDSWFQGFLKSRYVDEGAADLGRATIGQARAALGPDYEATCPEMKVAIDDLVEQARSGLDNALQAKETRRVMIDMLSRSLTTAQARSYLLYLEQAQGNDVVLAALSSNADMQEGLGDALRSSPLNMATNADMQEAMKRFSLTRIRPVFERCKAGGGTKR